LENTYTPLRVYSMQQVYLSSIRHISTNNQLAQTQQRVAFTIKRLEYVGAWSQSYNKPLYESATSQVKQS